MLLDDNVTKKKAKGRNNLRAKKIRKHDQVREEGTKKPSKQVTFWVSRRMRNTCNQLFPERSGEQSE